MKKLNKIMSGLMSVCLCVANVSATCISVSAESSENNWKYLYKEALNQLVADGWTMEDNSLFNGSRFDLYELNGNDVPELFVTHDNANHAEGIIFSVVNGKLTKSSVGVHYGSIMVNSVEHMVYYNANTSLLPSPNYYRFSEGILYDVTDSGENFDNITFESTGFKYSFDESVIENVFSSASSGTCGENLTYTLDDEGTLIISGTGNMTDFNFGKVPWNSSRESIKKVIIEDGVTSICSYAFYNCINLESITIPYGVTKIGGEAFSGCKSLISVTLPDSLTYIGGYSFNGCINLEEVTIPESVTYIADAAFCGCTNLKKVKLPNNLSIINIATFVQCKNLTSITIPDTVKVIDQRAFMDCESLRKITILNRECEIFDSNMTISNDSTTNDYFNGTIYGYKNSTAQTYAEKYNYKFVALDEIETTTTTTTTQTTSSTTTTTSPVTPPTDIKFGDADESGKVNINDAVLIMQSIANPDKYELTKKGKTNADVVDNGNGVTNTDALAIQYVESKTIKESDFPITSYELNNLGK